MDVRREFLKGYKKVWKYFRNKIKSLLLIHIEWLLEGWKRKISSSDL